MRIEGAPPASPLAQALYQGAIEAGHPETDDANGTAAEGVSWQEQNVVDHKRQSAADAYLRPALPRPNLTVVTDAYVRQLVMDGWAEKRLAGSRAKRPQFLPRLGGVVAGRTNSLGGMGSSLSYREPRTSRSRHARVKRVVLARIRASITC